MCEHEEGGEPRQVLPFIFSSSGQVFVECPLCARHTPRRGGEPMDVVLALVALTASQWRECPLRYYGKLMACLIAAFYLFRNSYLAKCNFFLLKEMKACS